MIMKAKKLWIVLLISIIAMSNIFCREKRWESGMKIKDKMEFGFDIGSNLVLWEENDSGNFAIAFIAYEDEYSAIDAYWSDGERVDKFPFLRKKIKFIPETGTGNQVTSGIIKGVDKNNVLVFIDARSRIWALDHRGRVLSGYPTKENAKLSPMQLWPPKIMDINNDGESKIIFLTKGFVPMIQADSIGDYGIYIADKKGKILQGYPVLFDKKYPISYPLEESPIYYDSNRVFITLSDGNITGLNMSTGKALNKFPVSLASFSEKSYDFNACAYREINSLIVTGMSDKIYKVDVDTGVCDRVVVKGAGKLSKVNTATLKGTVFEKEYLYCYDDDSARVIKFDSKLKEVDTIELGLVNAGKNLYFNTYNNAEKKASYIFLMNARSAARDIDELFAEHFTKEEERRIKNDMYGRFLKYYKTKKLNEEQIKEFDEFFKVQKTIDLEKKLGYFEVQDLLKLPVQTRVIVFKDDNKKIYKILDESIIDYICEGYAGDIPVPVPLIHIDKNSQDIYLILPLAVDRSKREMEIPKSMIRIFTISKDN